MGAWLQSLPGFLQVIESKSIERIDAARIFMIRLLNLLKNCIRLLLLDRAILLFSSFTLLLGQNLVIFPTTLSYSHFRIATRTLFLVLLFGDLLLLLIDLGT